MSVRGQSYHDWELILIDDGSTDGTGDECDTLALQDMRIKVVHQSNAGVSTARNNGIEQAQGEYVVFLDADDWWNYDFLEQMVGTLNNSDLPLCALTKVQKSGHETICEPLDFSSSPTRNIIACCRGLYLRAVLDKYHLRFSTSLKTGEDQEFVYKYLLYCQHPAYVPQAIYYYRMNETSTMYQRSYVHFDAVEAMKGAVVYAQEIGTQEQMDTYERDWIRFNAIRTIEFAILTLLTAGESWKKIYVYLQEHGYLGIISEALSSGDCYRSNFYDLWKKSPEDCLRRYAFRKFLGRFMRKIGLH